MPQEENEISWFEGFSNAMNVIFTEEDYKKYEEMVDIGFYKKYVRKGGKILDIGCGLGCTAVPLSKYFDVTGIDNDKRVVKAMLRSLVRRRLFMEIYT